MLFSWFTLFLLITVLIMWSWSICQRQSVSFLFHSNVQVILISEYLKRIFTKFFSGVFCIFLYDVGLFYNNMLYIIPSNRFYLLLSGNNSLLKHVGPILSRLQYGVKRRFKTLERSAFNTVNSNCHNKVPSNMNGKGLSLRRTLFNVPTDDFYLKLSLKSRTLLLVLKGVRLRRFYCNRKMFLLTSRKGV